MTLLKPDIDPAEVGFDRARLDAMDRRLGQYVEDGRLPGWAVAVSRHGHLAHVRACGHRDMEAGLPVETDTIFRVYSMTKPLTAVTALSVWEEGGFELNDPVRWYLPAFADVRVWRGGSAVRPVTDPVSEELRIWHLFTHTSGLTYGFLHAHPVDALYRAAGFEWGVPAGLDLAAVCDELTRLPLLFQPGTEWNYGMSTDVLGMVVQAVTGEPFADVMSSRVLGPLGMDQTTWCVGDDSADRLAALYTPVPRTRKATRNDAMGAGARHEPTATLGGGGLCSTLGDYVRFAAMLRGPRRARRHSRAGAEDRRLHGQQPPSGKRHADRVRASALRRDDVRGRRLRPRCQRHGGPSAGQGPRQHRRLRLGRARRARRSGSILSST